MTRTSHTLLTLSLSLLAAWVGSRLAKDGSPSGGAASDLRIRLIHSSSGISETRGDTGRMLRRAAGRCSTAALWKWVKESSNSAGNSDLKAVIEELLDREGPRAALTAIDLCDENSHGVLGAAFLGMLAKRDPWTAMDFYSKHHSDFEPTWGRAMLQECLIASGTVSSDKMIEVLRAAKGQTEPFETPVSYAAGFDFQSVADLSLQAGAGAPVFMGSMVSQWARQSPSQATRWAAEHAAANPKDDVAGPLLSTVVKGDDTPDRTSALNSIATLPEKARLDAWAEATYAEHGRLDPNVLEAATLMGDRDIFLSKLLRSIGVNDSPDPSWLNLPTEERSTILDSVLSQWAEEQPSSVASKARERWRASLIRAWDGHRP
jgi:hypothetical protein